MAGRNQPNRASSFDLAEYLAEIHRGDPATAERWLVANAGRMEEAMFFCPDNNWAGLTPEQILMLRAMAPPGVFTVQAEGKYLASVRGKKRLEKLSPALFGTDLDVITKLPPECRIMKSELTRLMHVANGISLAKSKRHF